MFDPAQTVLSCIRTYHKHAGRPGPWSAVMRRFTRQRHRFWSMISATDIRLGAVIGANLRMPHPNGITIHHAAVIGDGCMIMQQVTIGIIHDGPAPLIGSEVYLGAGAKILGGITIGDGARVGANAVVLQDVPPRWTAVGVPARLLPPSEERHKADG